MMASVDKNFNVFNASAVPTFSEQMYAVIKQSVVAANVRSIYDAKIIGILGDRRKHLFQSDILQYILFDDAVDHLLFQVGSDVPSSRIKEVFFNFPFSQRCFYGWDSPKTAIYYKDYKQIKLPIERAIREVASKRKEYRGWSKSICLLTAAGNLADPCGQLDGRLLLDIFIQGSDEEIVKLKKNLIGRARSWMEEYTGRFIRKVFPLQQAALVNALQESALKAPRTIFFAGISQAESKEAGKLYEFLEKTTFMLLNPERLGQSKYND